MPGLKEALGALAEPSGGRGQEPPPSGRGQPLQSWNGGGGPSGEPNTPLSAMRQYLLLEKERLTAAPTPTNQPMAATTAPRPARASVKLKKPKDSAKGGGGMFEGTEYRVRPLARGLYG
jgi:hypothetical protein